MGFVLEFDISGLFDNIDHDKLMKAVFKHSNEKWVQLFIAKTSRIDESCHQGIGESLYCLWENHGGSLGDGRRVILRCFINGN
jgi:retron-type reverse transcriptase